MHIKHIHETIEKLSKYACEEACKNKESINTEELGEVIDMIKDLAEAEYYARISKAMEEAEKEDEEEAKYILKTLKEEHKDEYKHYRDEYGEGADRRFYDDYRYKNSGRFAPKGKGSYMPIRGYEEMPYMMMPQVHNSMEWDRDMDRSTMNRMYYSSGGQGGQSSGGSSSGTNGNMGGSSGGSTRGYEEYQRGYSEGRAEGYNQGRSDGRNSQSRDYREGRSGRSRRGYMESKENHKGNSEQDKTEKMRSLEEYMKDLSSDITELIGDMDNSEKTMLRSKLQTLATKVQ